MPGRNHTQCLQRWTKVLAPGLVKGHWRPDEDDLLKELVAEGRKNWGQVATRIPGRTSKQCRERWYNHLDPSIVRGEYTAEEDRMILDAQARLGNRWSAIAAMLPGRTEDAVKIRWKSLCRVRKGQNRRVQPEKSKQELEEAAAMMHPAGPNPSAPFAGDMVKSEEVGSFSAMPPQMVRLPSGQIVAATSAYSPHAGAPTPGMTPTMATQATGAGMMTMMYTPGYDPTIAHYGKPPMAPQVVSSYGHIPMVGGVVNAGGMPPTQNAAAHSPSVDVSGAMMGLPSPSNGTGYSQQYAMTAGPGGAYVPDMSVYNNINNGQMYSTPQMGMYRGQTGMMMSPQVSPHHQHSPHHQMMNGSNNSFGYGLAATPTNGMMQQQNNGFNPAAAFAQQQQPQQQQQQQRQQQQQYVPQSTTTSANQEQEQPNPEAPPSPQVPNVKADPSAARPTPNPAAMFAQQQAKKIVAQPSSIMPGNPVAAFLKQQQMQKPSTAKPVSSSSSSSGPVKPFNPALAFAQRLQPTSAAHRPPPMPMAASAKTSEADYEDEDDAGALRGLKSVKPRLSVDAARASAARRLRNSGSGGALSGRPSLDVFLNEIGDVGRLSDLKMDEFQTLDELWRVSGDMARLSL